jgi:hypothetical protein
LALPHTSRLSKGSVNDVVTLSRDPSPISFDLNSLRIFDVPTKALRAAAWAAVGSSLVVDKVDLCSKRRH